ncbi:MAG: hypothetical protein K6U89_17670, partial [Chloroflexi bacterium]|nr:hypothetical protein [Chloroflexota bacterium]
IAKSPSTPKDFAEGFFNALAAAAEKLGLTLGQLMQQTRLLLHGTTVGTNAVVQLRGAKTGLITTRGHGDALIIMRSVGRSAGLPIEKLLHVSRHQKPAPIIPRTLIREVSERVDWRGEVFLPLNTDEARAAIQYLLDQQVEAIAIAFLWGFVNPAHELAVKRMVQEMSPSTFVTCAHELIAKPGEYERTAATAINCFIGPGSSGYIRRVQERATQLGYRQPLLIMQASGGVATASEAAQKPVFTIGSGPAGGIIGAKFLADLLGHRNVIASDVGGTSFDVGIISDGRPLTASETVIHQYTFFMPQLDIQSIGSGGGSVIWVDELSGTMKVGPHSAGADPGPACYNRGGEEPTITDANLLLGYLNPHNFLGGKFTLDTNSSVRAMRRVADRLGMDVVEAASGAVQIVEFHMADLMRQMTVQRGLDPRDFIVYAYGGGGPLHVVSYARELGCRTVVVPLGSVASTWSALGIQSADLLHVYEKAELLIAPFDHQRLNDIFAELEAKGRAQLREDGIAEDAMRVYRSADMKFRMQIHRVEVPVPGGLLTAQERYDRVVAVWNRAKDQLQERLMERLDPFNSVNMMATSGARGNVAQITQLSGMRGLMVDPSGRTIELPVKASLLEGLTVLEYFTSTHGARKGLADTALRTADSGYLTRRLVDVAQDVIVREEDCGTTAGVLVRPITDGTEVIEPLSARIVGRWSVRDVVHPETGEVLVPADREIDEEAARRATASSGVRLTILRYPALYGPGDTTPREWYYVRQVLDRRPVVIAPNGGQSLFSRGYLENMSHAVALAVEAPPVHHRVCNVADTGQFTVRQIIDAVAAILDHRWEVIDLPDGLLPPHRPSQALPYGIDPYHIQPHLLLDTTRLRAELGYADVVSPAAALEATVRWLAGRPDAVLAAPPLDYAAIDAAIDAARRGK